MYLFDIYYETFFCCRAAGAVSAAPTPTARAARINAAVAFLDNVIYGKCSKKEGKGLPSEEEKLMSQPFV
jgi:hypothetical protein